MKDKYHIIGILSIFISIYKLIVSIYEYLYGPPMYDPNVLHLFSLPRYCFFMSDWISFPLLLIGGLLILNFKRIAYYFYNIFFISYLVSFLFDLQLPNNFSQNIFFKILIAIPTIFGLYYFNKSQTKDELKIRKGLSIGLMTIIGIAYFLIISIQIIF